MRAEGCIRTGLLGSRLERRQGRPYQQSCGRREGAGYLGASGRAPFGLYSGSNAARQAGAAVLAFGDDPARERRRLATEPMRFGSPRPES